MTKPVTRKLAVDCLLDRIQRQFGEPLKCAVCGEPILPGQQIQFDHIHCDKLGGTHEYENLRPIHYDPCHKGKNKRDVAALAKVDRITGITGNGPKRRMPTRPFSKIKKVFPKGPKLKSRPFQRRPT